jgi:hypothetical protein
LNFDEYMPMVTVPEGESGKWKVNRFSLSEEDVKLARLRMAIGHSRDYTPPGTYTKLTNNGCIVMSDTYTERRDHIWAYMEAKGNVLISGLGLGMIAQSMLLKKNRDGGNAVEKVTIIELSPDVISLVAPHYQEMFGDRIEIINASILEWKPPRDAKYDFIWHDIWNDVCGDNWEEMKRVKRRFWKFSKNQLCWCEVETKRANR